MLLEDRFSRDPDLWFAVEGKKVCAKSDRKQLVAFFAGDNRELVENWKKRLPLELSSDRIRFIIQERRTRGEGQRPPRIFLYTLYFTSNVFVADF